jgi:hypothetical protein
MAMGYIIFQMEIFTKENSSKGFNMEEVFIRMLEHALTKENGCMDARKEREYFGHMETIMKANGIQLK